MFLRYVLVLSLLPCLILGWCTTSEMVHGVRKTIRKCCDGYKKGFKNGNRECIPICKVDCGKGTCSMPYTCKCRLGYANIDKITSNPCVPYCSKGCRNGECTNPEFCDCNPGYKWNKDSKQCDPVCSSGCPNAHCQSPGKCICNEGYKQIEAQTTDAGCEPDCKRDCGMNRTCIASKPCKCIEGLIELADKCGHAEDFPQADQFIWVEELMVGGFIFVAFLLVSVIYCILRAKCTAQKINKGKTTDDAVGCKNINFNRSESSHPLHLP